MCDGLAVVNSKEKEVANQIQLSHYTVAFVSMSYANLLEKEIWLLRITQMTRNLKFFVIPNSYCRNLLSLMFQALPNHSQPGEALLWHEWHLLFHVGHATSRRQGGGGEWRGRGERERSHQRDISEGGKGKRAH